MAARLHPDVWAEFVTGTHTSSGWSNLTTYRWSTRPLADPSTYEGGWKEGRVAKGGWDPIERTMSDPNGHHETSRFGWITNDTDRLTRGWLGGLTTEHLVNREASIHLVSETGRKAGTDARIIARGKIRDPQPLDDLRFAFKGEDIIGADFGILSGTKLLPQRTITRELFADVHRDLIGQPQPIIYGEITDGGASDGEGNRADKGLIPVFWVGTEEISGETWDRYLVAGHAMKDVHSWYASNLGSPAKREQQAPETAGDEFLIPGQSGWPFGDVYRDLTDTRGVTHRVTLIYAKGEKSEAHKSGSITITVNGCGIEDVGDGSGDLIRHGFRIYQHFLHNWNLCNDGKGYYTGNWPALTEWALAGPTVTQIKTETFADAQTFTGTRLGDGVGYLLDFVLSEQITVREAVKRFNLNLDCFLGVNRHAQLIVALVDDAADTSATTVFRDRIEIVSMPPPVIQHDGIENQVLFVYDWDAEKRKFRSDEQMIEDTAAQDALGEVRSSDLLKYYLIRDYPTACDSAARRLLRLKRAPRYQSTVLDLSGLEHDLGEFYRVTHYAGLGSSGYENHPFFCTKHKIDLNAMTVTLTGFDISRITAFAAPALDDADSIELFDDESAYELR